MYRMQGERAIETRRKTYRIARVSRIWEMYIVNYIVCDCQCECDGSLYRKEVENSRLHSFCDITQANKIMTDSLQNKVSMLGVF